MPMGPGGNFAPVPSRIWGAAGACSELEHPCVQWEMKGCNVQRGDPHCPRSVILHGHREGTHARHSVSVCVCCSRIRIFWIFFIKEFLVIYRCLLTLSMCLVLWFACCIADNDPEVPIASNFCVINTSINCF